MKNLQNKFYKTYKDIYHHRYQFNKNEKKDALFLQEYLREKLEEEKMFKIFVDHVEKTCPEGLGDIETWLEDFNSELDDSPSEKEVDQFLDQFTVIKHD